MSYQEYRDITSDSQSVSKEMCATSHNTASVSTGTSVPQSMIAHLFASKLSQNLTHIGVRHILLPHQCELDAEARAFGGINGSSNASICRRGIDLDLSEVLTGNVGSSSSQFVCGKSGVYGAFFGTDDFKLSPEDFSQRLMSFLIGFRDALSSTSNIRGIVFGNSIGYLLNKAFVASIPSECGFVRISDDTDFSMAVDPKLGPLVAKNIAVFFREILSLVGNSGIRVFWKSRKVSSADKINSAWQCDSTLLRELGIVHRPPGFIDVGGGSASVRVYHEESDSYVTTLKFKGKANDCLSDPTKIEPFISSFMEWLGTIPGFDSSWVVIQTGQIRNIVEETRTVDCF